jgi:hypothetical protein
MATFRAALAGDPFGRTNKKPGFGPAFQIHKS